jgi:hypothetical protein
MNLTITDDTERTEVEAELARLQAWQASYHKDIEAVNVSAASDDAKAVWIDYIDDELAAITDEISDCVWALDNYATDRGGVTDALADRNWYHGRVL